MADAVGVPSVCVPMLTLGTLGTLLVFRSLSGFVMKFVRSRPRLYYRGLNLFTLRQWLSKVHTTYLTQTVVCIMLLLATGITASSVGLNNTIATLSYNQAPFDITVENYFDGEEPQDVGQLLREAGFDTEKELCWEYGPSFTATTPLSPALRVRTRP